MGAFDSVGVGDLRRRFHFQETIPWLEEEIVLDPGRPGVGDSWRLSAQDDFRRGGAQDASG